MRLITHSKCALRRAGHRRLFGLAVVLTTAEAVLPLFTDMLPRGPLAALTVVVVAGGFYARRLAQADGR